MFKRVAKSLHPPTCEESSWCWSSASFCFWGSPEEINKNDFVEVRYNLSLFFLLQAHLQSVFHSLAALTVLPSLLLQTNKNMYMLLNQSLISSASTRDEDYQPLWEVTRIALFLQSNQMPTWKDQGAAMLNKQLTGIKQKLCPEADTPAQHLIHNSQLLFHYSSTIVTEVLKK